MSVSDLDDVQAEQLANLLESARRKAASHEPMRFAVPAMQAADLKDMLASVRDMTPRVKQTDSVDLIRALRDE